MKRGKYYLLPAPVLFLEFFTREFTFSGKGVKRSKFPADANFYTGPSKATGYRFYQTNKGPVQLSTQHDRISGFDNDGPAITAKLLQRQGEKFFTNQSNLVIGTAGEYYDLYTKHWYRTQEVWKVNKYHPDCSEELRFATASTLTPHHFNILDVNAEGIVSTDFPRHEVALHIKPQETLCFLCRREEYSIEDHYEPNLNLVMFVKNHGWHEKLRILSDIDTHQLDSARLCQEEHLLRDYRKSKLRYQLG
ncbi:hypothetical protein KTO58_21870 [Chitinophaga pendula]|uniref:hypothetical protein n=1 Tax=Chitinophaga TaxID=79328 RepID=UPI000BAEDA5E|nr:MULTISPECIES: hypothetical protein [Chitinophaga]ASZ10728.1 hypothetical protein CK934_06920 [Chitinophaga sp. MD30]UCJ06295.1 hypothetical protein KTO58_21870 [Chitinophaga pendula]